MEPSLSANTPIPIVIVLYDFRYMWKDNREIAVKKGEKLLLLEKTNKDWWQVVRPTEKKSFFVPAQYVDIYTKKNHEKENYESHSGFTEDDSVLYENLESLKQSLDLPRLFSFRKSDFIALNYNKDGNNLQDGCKQKPVPKTRTKVTVNKSVKDSTDKLSESDSNHSQSQNLDSDKYDKGDKSKIGVDIAQDFVPSLPKDLSVLQGDKKNFKSKSETVAVENKVYCNVPVGKNKNNIEKQNVNSSVISNQSHIDAGKNRMKNSYNLKTKPIKAIDLQNQATTNKPEVKHCSVSSKNDKLLFNQNLSKSLEKLAEEIQFEPRKTKATPTLTSSVQSKSKSTKMPKDNLEKKTEKKGKTADASIVLNEKVQPQSRSMFSRFRRSLHHSSSFKSNNLKKLGKAQKKICELSLSWEGGLDKIQENKVCEEKPQVTPMGLQRSRTFMFAERSPLALRPANKIFTRKDRLDTAYHSQRKPDEKVTLSTFKPILNIDKTNKLDDIKKNKIEKEFINRQNSDKDKILENISESVNEEIKENKNKNEMESFSKMDKNFSKSVENKNYHTVAIPKDETNSPVTRQKGLTLYSEPYSNSESEDNLEEKSLTNIANKALRSQSSIDSNITASEGTEASDSDENSSLEFIIDDRSSFNQQSTNKRRTSLVRSSRVESSKVRKITARLPSTPPLDQKPIKDLGNGWGQYLSKGGRCYYYNENTGEKNWKPPRKTFEKPFIGSRESVSSDANRSNTSSPLNENYLQNSLKSSDGSLHSKSNVLESSGPDISKSGSRWKEDSPDYFLDDLNRSSYNSSPITGLSQSSYSLNKSSRDSLNRFSPVDNVPSEEEGFELSDHVYQDDKNKTNEDKSKNEEGRKRSRENVDISTFRIKPGWEEFYDENLDQIYYVHKSRKEKWILSFDSEERAYFFEEKSKKSLWALPDYSNEAFRLDSNFSIQRSATESAISNEAESKLRQKKDDGKSGWISASTRSSKTQSMLIEPKFDISAKDGNKTFSMPRDLSKIYGEIIRIGILNKTKICENGKKLRKNWTPAFVVLSESYLFFFKDAKSFKNMKNVISSNGNHMCLTLQGAVIEKGDKISSRKNVYKISSLDNTEILIQTEKTAEAEEWFKDISSVIQKLPREPCANRNSPLLDANSPSKVGPMKTVKVKNKETGSMEDLTSTPEERQNKIKARLKKFFIRRPTVDSLKKKGIWKDEPVFGCSLDHITKNRNPRVPIFVEKCIECIESKEENMKTDGLYRASGNLSQVQKIRLEVDQNNLSIMKDEEDVHVLTGSLKLFFRELKEPLIPSKQLEPALLATDKQVRKERIKDFQKIVKSLPTPNYDTLKFLLQHLLRVKEYHKFNRMNINNLAIVFGPTLMWPEQESANMALELMQQNVVIECLLKEFHEIFT